jgi:hypothetical protein
LKDNILLDDYIIPCQKIETNIFVYLGWVLFQRKKTSACKEGDLLVLATFSGEFLGVGKDAGAQANFENYNNSFLYFPEVGILTYTSTPSPTP